MDPFTKMTLITAILCWIYFFIVRAEAIGEWFHSTDKSLWEDVIIETSYGWMLFFIAFVCSNILLVKWLYNAL